MKLFRIAMGLVLTAPEVVQADDLVLRELRPRCEDEE